MPVYKTYNCLCCGTLNQHRPNTRGKYCNNKCQQKHTRQLFVNEWLSGNVKMEDTYSGVNNTISQHIRNFLIEESDYKCSQCAWGEINTKTGLVPLQVDHVDGNSTNNARENLRVLCPNCHSLTHTYGRHGAGRKKRYAGMM